MSQTSEAIVRCRGLTKRYGEITALEDLTVSIGRGQIFGYIGHNGAGKTTTIRILAGLLKPTAGEAAVGGVDVVAHPSRIKCLVGYMPDSFGVYDQMRAWEYLDFFGAAFKIPRRPRRKRIDHVLDVAGADHLRDRFVDTLSRGMKQRIGIARTLLHDPPVLLLDEPASGLDPQARVQMRGLLRRLADEGKTLLVSSHILPELAAVCDCVGIIDHGRLLASGPIDEVLGRLQRDRMMEVRALAGLPAAAATLSESPECSRIDETDSAAGVLRFRFSGDDEGLARLLARLLSGNVKVAGFREIPLSLEDAYLAISGHLPGQEPDAEPDDAPPPVERAGPDAQAQPGGDA